MGFHQVEGFVDGVGAGLNEEFDEGFDCSDRHGEVGVFVEESVVGLDDAVRGVSQIVQGELRGEQTRRVWLYCPGGCFLRLPFWLRREGDRLREEGLWFLRRRIEMLFCC